MKANMNIKSIIMIIAVIYLASMLFINMSFAANTGKISVETAKLREEPNTDCKVLELMSQGEEVEILSEEDQWYKIKYKKITGYVRQDLVQVENKTENTNNETKNTSTETAQTTNEVSTETTTETNTEKPTNEVSAETTTEQAKVEEIDKSKKYKISENVKLKVIPLISAIELDELTKSTEIEVTEILNNWIKVKTADGKTGWIRKEKVEDASQAKAQTTTVAKTMYINSQTVNVRQEPSTTSGLVKQLSLNTKVNVLSSENGWSCVEIDGVNAYISERLLSSTKQQTSRSATTTRTTQSTASTQTAQTPTNATTNTATSTATASGANDIVAYAKQFLGCRYVYGGTTTNGFDCSGFTQYVYRHFGINLNRTAAAQYSNGKSVSNLQPGDLLMFGKAGINHVGIYIGGNSFIHAANKSRGVTIDSISSGYYKTNYVGARRVL